MIGRALRLCCWSPRNQAALGDRLWAVIGYLQTGAPVTYGIVARSTGRCRTLEARRLAFK